MLTGIITEYCNLNKHLHTISLCDTDMCRGCLDEEETLIYILCHYEAYNTQRVSNFGLEKIVPEDAHKIPWRGGLLAFLRSWNSVKAFVY